jgi:two-component system, NarL family, nitrate/nitrite response regulator NarL
MSAWEGSGRHPLSERSDSAAKPSVFILGDVRLYREGLSWHLIRDGSLEVVGAAEPSPAVLDAITALAPAAIIFDLAMPSCLDLARELRSRVPGSKLVAFAVSNVDHDIVGGAMAGIAGYVRRDGGVEDLVSEVLNAVRGELHCSPRLAARLLEQLASLACGNGRTDRATDEAERPGRPLTRRETEILALVEKGLSNKEIARTLNISFATVKNHVHHILEKLHVSRRGEAGARPKWRRDATTLVQTQVRSSGS